MDVSSTFMNVASESAIVPATRRPPGERGRGVHVPAATRDCAMCGQAVAALVARIDLHLHREAHLQRMLAELAALERDAHRHALHDLHPVAAGVLRREEREAPPGAGAEAATFPWYSSLLP
jgi:hypothetical protein